MAAPCLAADPPDLIVSSDLQRAVRTAQELTRLIDVPMGVEPRLREIDLGSWQGLTRDEVKARYPQQYAAWRDGRIPIERGGETRPQLDARVLAALRDIDVDKVLLVTHGGTSRSVIEVLLDLPSHPGRWLRVLGNCHWSQLRHYPEGWQLRAHNLTISKPLPGDPPPDADENGDADAVDEAAGEGVDEAASVTSGDGGGSGTAGA